jgi:exosortase family protein XrtF
VANQTKTLLSVFDYEVETLQHTDEMSMKVILNNTYVSRVIEGCNSISIIILFIAFIVAFRGGIKETIIFGAIGSIIIYGVNIVRISFLTVMIYEYQHYQDVLHNIVFPLIIYGTTFLLWIVWVHKFSNYRK